MIFDARNSPGGGTTTITAIGAGGEPMVVLQLFLTPAHNKDHARADSCKEQSCLHCRVASPCTVHTVGIDELLV